MPSPQHQETVLLEELVRSNEGGRVAGKAKAQFAGRLVLTDRRLIFLSSGKGAGPLGLYAPFVVFGAACGSLLADLADDEALEKAAANLPPAAVYNDGGWLFELNNVRVCEFVSSWRAAPHVRVEGLVAGRRTARVLYRRGLAKEKLRKLAECITHAAWARRRER